MEERASSARATDAGSGGEEEATDVHRRTVADFTDGHRGATDFLATKMCASSVEAAPDGCSTVWLEVY
ncbi:MAG: hypothetical protein D6723_17225 [Acidobacteria bacterium]|nr:MAG: hypothetical protein D6723_17225 [Acidobacteriota bacterium]